MFYTIRKAKEQDMPQIVKIYEIARQIMAESGNPNQWGNTNPPREQLVEDIRSGNMLLIGHGEEIHGAFSLISGADPTYSVIYDGSWSWDEPYHTVHRLAGDGNGGIFRTCMDYCKSNCSYIRIDTHRDNRIMLHLLEKEGFRRCGIIHLADGSERIAFDLIVKKTGIK